MRKRGGAGGAGITRRKGPEGEADEPGNPGVMPGVLLVEKGDHHSALRDSRSAPIFSHLQIHKHKRVQRSMRGGFWTRAGHFYPHVITHTLTQ